MKFVVFSIFLLCLRSNAITENAVLVLTEAVTLLVDKTEAPVTNLE